MKIEKQTKTTKAQPFGAHFTTKLEGANNKLVCALSAATTCSDDTIIVRPWEPAEPVLA
jgi:hypothetical protein